MRFLYLVIGGCLSSGSLVGIIIFYCYHWRKPNGNVFGQILPLMLGALFGFGAALVVGSLIL